MSASRKLYVALAEKYRELRPKENDPEWSTWVVMICATANVLRHDNSGFDRQKFLLACGMGALQAHVATDTLAR